MEAVARDGANRRVVHFSGGGRHTFYGMNDHLSNTSISINTNGGFPVAYPDVRRRAV
jgi:hypothetical protein